jgi:hypothetical protein
VSVEQKRLTAWAEILERSRVGEPEGIIASAFLAHTATVAALEERVKRLERVEAVAKRIVRDAPHTDSETLRRHHVRIDWTGNAQQVEDLRAALRPSGEGGGSDA